MTSIPLWLPYVFFCVLSILGYQSLTPPHHLLPGHHGVSSFTPSHTSSLTFCRTSPQTKPSEKNLSYNQSPLKLFFTHVLYQQWRPDRSKESNIELLSSLCNDVRKGTRKKVLWLDVFATEA